MRPAGDCVDDSANDPTLSGARASVLVVHRAPAAGSSAAVGSAWHGARHRRTSPPSSGSDYGLGARLNRACWLIPGARATWLQRMVRIQVGTSCGRHRARATLDRDPYRYGVAAIAVRLLRVGVDYGCRCRRVAAEGRLQTGICSLHPSRRSEAASRMPAWHPRWLMLRETGRDPRPHWRRHHSWQNQECRSPLNRRDQRYQRR